MNELERKLKQKNETIFFLLVCILGIVITIVTARDTTTDEHEKVAGIYNFTDHREVENWLWQLQNEGYRAILWAHPVDMEEVNVTYCDNGECLTYYTHIPKGDVENLQEKIKTGNKKVQEGYEFASDDAGVFYLINESKVDLLLWHNKDEENLKITIRKEDRIQTYETEIPYWKWDEISPYFQKIKF